MSEKHSNHSCFGRILFSAVLVIAATVISCMIVNQILYAVPDVAERTGNGPDLSIMDSLDLFVESTLQESEHAAKNVHKYFWIEADASICPVPDQDCYGQAESASQLQWLLDDAAELLNGQATLFNTGIEVLEGSPIDYYLDDSILAITWKQVYDDFVYTISEVKIADPSQFRRYFVEDTYNYPKHYLSTDMAQLNNAVVASSADFYRNRPYGTVVYNREALRLIYPHLMDVCFVDGSGNLNFKYRNEITSMEALQQYVDENDILFSLCFGPVLVDNGVQCNPESYSVGEIYGGYPRAALCQYDELHYIVLTATAEAGYDSFHSVQQLADVVGSFGCQKAYTLDGGQTANLVMNNRLINKLNYPNMRPMSDIIYFATAVPNHENTGSRN